MRTAPWDMHKHSHLVEKALIIIFIPYNGICKKAIAVATLTCQRARESRVEPEKRSGSMIIVGLEGSDDHRFGDIAKAVIYAAAKKITARRVCVFPSDSTLPLPTCQPIALEACRLAPIPVPVLVQVSGLPESRQNFAGKVLFYHPQGQAPITSLQGILLLPLVAGVSQPPLQTSHGQHRYS